MSPDDDKWWLPAESANQLRKGGARADAVATIDKATGEIRNHPWGEACSWTERNASALEALVRVYFSSD